jgi:hypothetical protein
MRGGLCLLGLAHEPMGLVDQVTTHHQTGKRPLRQGPQDPRYGSDASATQAGDVASVSIDSLAPRSVGEYAYERLPPVYAVRHG